MSGGVTIRREPQGVAERIESLYAVLGVNQDGREGIAAWISPDGPLPLVCAGEAQLPMLKECALRLARAGGGPARLARFTSREDLAEYTRA